MTNGVDWCFNGFHDYNITNDFVFVKHIVLRIFPNRAKVVSALFYPSLEKESVAAIPLSKQRGYSPSFPRRRKDTRHPSLEEVSQVYA